MKAPIWQKGFSEVRITDREAFLRVRTYIRNNPVARHLAAHPEEYPHSSAHPGFELDPVPRALEILHTAESARKLSNLSAKAELNSCLYGMPEGIP